FSNGAIELQNERIEISCDVQQPDRLGMQAELSPGDDLAEFFKRSETAGHRDEAVGKLHHQRFAFVHRTDNAQFREVNAPDFTSEQSVRDDADDLAAPHLNRLGNLSHQADTASSIYEADCS